MKRIQSNLLLKQNNYKSYFRFCYNNNNVFKIKNNNNYKYVISKTKIKDHKLNQIVDFISLSNDIKDSNIVENYSNKDILNLIQIYKKYNNIILDDSSYTNYLKQQKINLNTKYLSLSNIIHYMTIENELCSILDKSSLIAEKFNADKETNNYFNLNNKHNRYITSKFGINKMDYSYNSRTDFNNKINVNYIENSQPFMYKINNLSELESSESDDQLKNNVIIKIIEDNNSIDDNNKFTEFLFYNMEYKIDDILFIKLLQNKINIISNLTTTKDLDSFLFEEYITLLINLRTLSTDTVKYIIENIYKNSTFSNILYDFYQELNSLDYYNKLNEIKEIEFNKILKNDKYKTEKIKYYNFKEHELKQKYLSNNKKLINFYYNSNNIFNLIEIFNRLSFIKAKKINIFKAPNNKDDNNNTNTNEIGNRKEDSIYYQYSDVNSNENSLDKEYKYKKGLNNSLDKTESYFNNINKEFDKIFYNEINIDNSLFLDIIKFNFFISKLSFSKSNNVGYFLKLCNIIDLIDEFLKHINKNVKNKINIDSKKTDFIKDIIINNLSIDILLDNMIIFYVYIINNYENKSNYIEQDLYFLRYNTLLTNIYKLSNIISIIIDNELIKDNVLNKEGLNILKEDSYSLIDLKISFIDNNILYKKLESLFLLTINIVNIKNYFNKLCSLDDLISLCNFILSNVYNSMFKDKNTLLFGIISFVCYNTINHLNNRLDTIDIENDVLEIFLFVNKIYSYLYYKYNILELDIIKEFKETIQNTIYNNINIHYKIVSKTNFKLTLFESIIQASKDLAYDNKIPLLDMEFIIYLVEFVKLSKQIDNL